MIYHVVLALRTSLERTAGNRDSFTIRQLRQKVNNFSLSGAMPKALNTDHLRIAFD